MSTNRITATLVLMLVCAPASQAFAQESGEPTSEGDRGLRFGVLVGLLGQFPIGADVGQDGAPGDEFGPAMAIQIEFLTFDIERYVQIVPYFRRTVVGGIDEDTYQAVFGDAADVTKSHMMQVGIGGRWFFVQFDRLRPFAALYLAYATTDVTYEYDAGSGLPPELAGLATTAESWRHTGMALTLGAGLRWDFDVAFWNQEWIMPLIVEAQWTKNFWMGSERNSSLGIDESLLAPEGMNLDLLSIYLSFGLLY